MGERVDVWTLRVKSIAVEGSHADVPDNRPLSGRFIGRSLFRETGQQLVRSLARLVARHLGVSLRTVLPVTGATRCPCAVVPG